jgi:hypothetical protein
MDIPLNAKVSCSDGPSGHSVYLVLMPTSNKITHVVVDDGSFPETQYLVPIDRILKSAPESIQLNCTLDELSKMPVFNQVEFIRSGLNGTSGSFSTYWPYATLGPDFIATDNKPLPVNELAIRRGAGVEATDGHVGHVGEFLIDPINNTISHIILCEGHLWGEKDVTIPLSQINCIEENTVWLKLNKRSIEALPAIPIHHYWQP